MKVISSVRSVIANELGRRERMLAVESGGGHRRIEVLERLGQVLPADLARNLHAVLVVEADEARVGAVTQQHVDDLDAVRAQRQVHRRVHVVVLGVDRRAALQQERDDLAVTVLNSRIQN